MISRCRNICFPMNRPRPHCVLGMHAFVRLYSGPFAGHAMVPEHIARESRGIHLSSLRAIPRVAPFAAEASYPPGNGNDLLFAVVSGWNCAGETFHRACATAGLWADDMD